MAQGRGELGVSKDSVFESVDSEIHFLRTQDLKVEAIYLTPFWLGGHGPKIFSWGLEGRGLGGEGDLIKGPIERVKI